MAEQQVDADEQADEIWQTHIHAPDKEYTVHASVIVDSPELEHAATRRGDNRELILSEGGDVIDEGPVPSDDHPFVSQFAEEHDLSRTALHDRGVAVGYYMHHLETHAVPEEETYSQLEMLSEERDLPLGEFLEFYNDLDERSRRLRLLDLLDWRVDEGGDWSAAPYRDTGKWRSTDLTESGSKLAQQIGKNLDLNPQHCYRNAQQAAIQHKNNHRVEYVEGIALPKVGAQVSRHAWIEIDGEVAELTWPWHFFDGQQAVYFGTTFDKGKVEETFERRNGGSQIALSDEETKKIQALRSGEV